ncbi:uncharacterized protein LOC133174919 [Saccostrea echinata]|uniref:uncharacterized protein LOC133174919 n=1 Tax=Saccostrea echinata TaxID=191078 RepID=UPI002A825867|nr:uncharacterized protein LOC133174919 [Saccostrea echinata]
MSTKETLCFCTENVTAGVIKNLTCNQQNSRNFKNDLIGTGNDTRTGTGNYVFALYRKVRVNTEIDETLGECLLKTNEGYKTYPCDSADNTKRTWAGSVSEGTYLNGKKMNNLPRWLPYVRRLMINWNDGSSTVEQGTVCISVREQNRAYEAIPRHCHETFTSICQGKRTESSFLIVGCALITVSGALLITSAIFFIKAKRLKNRMLSFSL